MNLTIMHATAKTTPIQINKEKPKLVGEVTQAIHIATGEDKPQHKPGRKRDRRDVRFY